MAPAPRRRRLVREHDRPHHLPPVGDQLLCTGLVVGRGPCPAISSPSTTTAPSVSGEWDVTPAIHIHTELHRRRPRRRRGRAQPPSLCAPVPRGDRRAARPRTPELVDPRRRAGAGRQSTTARLHQPALGADLASRIGDASVVLLVSHGERSNSPLPTMCEAVYKAVLFECTVHAALVGVLVMDRAPHRDRGDPPEAVEGVAGPAGGAGLLERRRAHARGRVEPDVLA